MFKGFLVLWLMFCASFVHATTLHGRIVAVLDGDTVILLDGQRREHRIRLAEIDAPEKAQAFGQRSKQSLSDMAYNREAEARCPDTDRYGREVCRLYVGSTNVNLEQVHRGMAWCYRQYAKDAAIYRAEDDARTARRGLWSDANPTPPWEWRRKQ